MIVSCIVSYFDYFLYNCCFNALTYLFSQSVNRTLSSFPQPALSHWSIERVFRYTALSHDALPSSVLVESIEMDTDKIEDHNMEVEEVVEKVRAIWIIIIFAINHRFEFGSRVIDCNYR